MCVGRGRLGRIDIGSPNVKKRNRRCDPQKQAYWEDMLRRWQASGQTVRNDCHDAGVRESALYFWRRELARRSQSSEATGPSPTTSPVTPAPRSLPRSRHSTPSFLPVRVVDSVAMGASRAVEIVLAQGRTVRVGAGFDRRTLVDVLAVLEVQPC